LLAFFWRRYVELLAPVRCPASEWWLAVGAGLAVFIVWIQLDRGWATLGGGGPGFDPTGPDGRIDPWIAGLRLASLALVVPVMAELFWGSVLLRWRDARACSFADPRRTSLRAFVLVAVLFALEHDLWLAGLISGIVYNWLYVRTGRLWIPIASHAVTNGALGVWILSTRSWHLW
jgi:CAAX prenyl protease-like protein